MVRAVCGSLALLLVAAGVASAQPSPARACLDKGRSAALFTSGGQLLIVGDEKHISLEGEPTVVAAPAKLDPKPHIPDAIRHRGKRVMACVGKRCRTLGRTAATKFPEPTTLTSRLDVEGGIGIESAEVGGWMGTVTADLRLLVHNNTFVYSIARDREIQLVPPAGAPADRRSLQVEPYGNVLLALWQNQGTIHTERGVIGAPFPYGARVELPRRLVVAGSLVTVIDTKSGKQLGSLELHPDVEGRSAVKLGPDRVAVAWEVDGKWSVSWIELSRAGVPTIEKTVAVAVCP